MRKFMPLLTVPCLLVAALGFLSPIAPVAFAADFPALPDGGSFVGDAGAVTDLRIRGPGQWQMAIRCEGTNGTTQVTRYVMCDNATCPVTSANQVLTQDITYDILVPAGFSYLGLAQDDAGFPTCKIQYVRPRTLPEIP